MLHETQKVLLKRLLDKNGLKYGQLTRGYDFEDNVVFHLRQLADKGLIEKADGEYTITAAGVKEITGYNLPDLADSGWKTFFAGIVCSFENNYLVKGHPQGKTNFFNLPSGKPIFGENIDSGLVKIFAEYTGLQLQPKDFSFVSLHLKTVKTSAGEVLFDDAFTIYKIQLDKAQFEQTKLQKNALWVTADNISKLANRWPELDILILKKDTRPYMAYEVISDYILE